MSGHPHSMKTRFFATAALFLGGTLAVAPGCTAGTSSQAASVGVGDPCPPLIEGDATFLGFNEQEVNFESGSPSCKTGVCLINHFRGRVSCPYGQTADGAAPPGGKPCTTPSGAPVTGGATDPRKKAQVSAQCVDRTADKTVYCSCRCANEGGRTDDGAAYCACPDGFACTSVISSIGGSTKSIAGSYCVKNGTVYDPNTACNQGDCDPVRKTCG